MILAFDTSGPHCAAALMQGDTVLASLTEEMSRGQAERLMPLLEEILAAGGVNWRDLDVLAVGIGPGNFTGIRIAVSAARGLALGLGIPAIGVSTLDAIRHLHPRATAAVPAPRDMIYAQPPGGAPMLVAASEFPDAVLAPGPEALVAAMAEMAASADARDADRPKPLYIKPADAAPSREGAPVILP